MGEDLRRAGAGRLHAEQQTTAALKLPEGTEYGVAQLQLDPQALVERTLDLLRQ
ncbi:hypothetical protein D3C80_1734160 [compost metagenome]